METQGINNSGIPEDKIEEFLKESSLVLIKKCNDIVEEFLKTQDRMPANDKDWALLSREILMNAVSTYDGFILNEWTKDDDTTIN